MTSVYARTREREKAWKFGMYCLLGALVVAPFWYLIFSEYVIGRSTFMKVYQLSPPRRPFKLYTSLTPHSSSGSSPKSSNLSV